MGHHDYLWKGGDSAYAASAARLLGVEDLLFGCFEKAGTPPVSVTDQPGMTERYGAYTALLRAVETPWPN